jgi:hypothetical protein
MPYGRLRYFGKPIHVDPGFHDPPFGGRTQAAGDTPGAEAGAQSAIQGESGVRRAAGRCGGEQCRVLDFHLHPVRVALPVDRREQCGLFMAWDPYPFILLNLVLSFQAAFTAPIIMMSQNRQSTIDRRNAQHDYDVNTKAELEIELLHQKVDLMREQELTVLLQMVKRLEDRLMLGEGDGERSGS